MQSTTNNERVELSTYFGDKEYADRVAKTYLVKRHYYEVDFIENDVVVETRIMTVSYTHLTLPTNREV